MRDRDNRCNGLQVPATDLRPKKRREGEAVQVFERIIDRPVPSPSAAKIRKPKYDRLRPYEQVLYEAPS